MRIALILRISSLSLRFSHSYKTLRECAILSQASPVLISNVGIFPGSSKYGFEPEKCNVAECVAQISNEERKTVVVKTDHSAVIADLKYVYFCADYVRV